MLAKKLIPTLSTTLRKAKLTDFCKRKTPQSAKITTLPKNLFSCAGLLFVLLFDFLYLFCGGSNNSKSLIANSVKQRFELSSLR